ncbi:MAG: protein-L-isoaspartate(D-aspartate) O-methyltransferase [Ardenticatenaceae bacterium]|nr:protein-L-isoaspartate(D-aspartate) O-methyltransferase [Ardenticatenaceae bacterium]
MYEPWAAEQRQRLVMHRLWCRGVRDRRVLAAMASVPRHRFVPEPFQWEAYRDRPLPIGCRQTISQPFVVALMTEALALRPGDRVLEIGTGSGYQTAILSRLAAEIYSIERYSWLAERAYRVLGELSYANVFLRVGDGSLGWVERAPFDAILVTAAAPGVPPPLLEQLALGGRMVVPVGERRAQQLVRLVRGADGQLTRQVLEAVRFVPLIGSFGWSGSEESGTHTKGVVNGK